MAADNLVFLRNAEMAVAQVIRANAAGKIIVCYSPSNNDIPSATCDLAI